jgi:two-component system repressor protein LuxO
MPAIAEASNFKSEEAPRVVLISERQEILAACTQQVTLAGFLVSTAGYSDGVMEILHRDKPPLTVVDLSLPNAVGLEVIEAVQRDRLETAVIAISRDGSLKLAVQAMKLGAFDYLPEPFDSDRLISAMCNALGRPAPAIPLDRKRRTGEEFQGFIGLSPAMREVCKAIQDAGSKNASVLITGQRGLEREVCAQAIHACGPRRHQPYVTINCAALPKGLVEAELFGHVAGAFPGAVTDRAGLVKEAHGGTLFIDEICELDLQTQRKTLRLAQNGSFQRVGSGQPARVDLRIICATSSDPGTEVKEGLLLKDLFDSLSAISIHLPAFSQPGKDTMLIARYFLFGKLPSASKALQKLTPEATAQGRKYGWSGGARELQNALQIAITVSDDRAPDASPLQQSAEPPHEDRRNVAELTGRGAPIPPETAAEQASRPSNLYGLWKKKPLQKF